MEALNTEFNIDEDLLAEELGIEEGPQELSVTANQEPPKTSLMAFEEYQARRPSITKSAWDPKLLFDLALEMDDIEDILLRHNLTYEQLGQMYGNAMFRSEVITLRSDLQKEGLTLKLKARMLSEDYLDIMDKMVHDIHIPAGQRLDVIKQVNKLGDVEPKKDSKDGAGGAGSFNIQINIQ